MNPRAIGVNPVARIGTIVEQMNRPFISLMGADTALIASTYDKFSQEQKKKAMLYFIKLVEEGRC